MAAFYDYFNEQKYADAVKNVSVFPSVTHGVEPLLSLWSESWPLRGRRVHTALSVRAVANVTPLSPVPGPDLVLRALGP